MQRFLLFFRARLATPLLYVLIAACALGANPFRGETVGPFDLLASYPGWNPTGELVEVRYRERMDILDALMPTWIDARKQIHEGNIPLWNDMRAGGIPALLDPTNALMTLPFAVFAATPDPALGFYLAMLATLVAAGLGMHCLVRRYCGWGASLFAGISYMMCGFITAWLYWPHTYTAMWIPWLLLAVDAYIKRGAFLGLVPIAVFTALLLLGGFPYVVVIGLGAAIVWSVVQSIQYQPGDVLPNTVGVLLAMALGLGLAAVPLLTMTDSVMTADLSYRSAGSPLNLSAHAKLLSWPWAQRMLSVESAMYTGMLALALAVFAVGAVLARKIKGDAMVWSALVFLVVGVVLTFGILPKEIGAHLPVLSNNPWNRTLLLMEIGLILLASKGLDWIRSRIRSQVVAAILIGLACSLQAADLGIQFRRYNGPVAKQYFYPGTPELTALQQRARPFQYVGQDSPSYVYSGTLGAVGLREWYAHALRPQALHFLLDAMASDAFPSPTSTNVSLEKYRWDNPILDAVGLCYGVSARSGADWVKAIEVKGIERVALAPINDISVRQPIKIDATMVSPALDVRLANYGSTGLDGWVNLDLVAMPEGHPVARAAIPAEDVVNNKFASFRFDSPVVLPSGSYEIRLEYKPGRKNMNLTAWYLHDAPGNLMRGDQAVAGALEYVLYRANKDSMREILRGPRTVVTENPGCAQGPYFSTRPLLSMVDAGQATVLVKKYSPDQFELTVSTPRPGYIVIPMQYRNGWQANLNGSPVAITHVAGVLPAVAVAGGSSTLQMQYRPPRIRLGLAMTGIAILIIVLGAWFARRTKGGPKASSASD